uniref:Leucine rich immune protein (Coil-less) n=1 Tax=Anopheles melas TaxID=34690 RepID=A0A182TS06_9DIPT
MQQHQTTVNLSPWTNGPAIVQSAPQPCQLQGAKCVYDKLNLSADGLQRLRTSGRDLPQVFQIDVKLLITPYPDGVLLQLISEFVQEVVYENYHERILRIPPVSALTDLVFRKAPPLQTIAVAAPNNRLTTLSIKQSNIRSMPSALTNLRQLATLALENGALESVSLEPLANCLQLSILILILDNNLLETIDGAFFLPLRRLAYLDLGSNRIQRIEGRPLSLPQVMYIQLVSNQLAELDVTRWNLPNAIEIYLDNNNLTRVPIGIQTLPNLTTLVLPNNLLTVVDLRRLSGWTKLQRINLAGNRLTRVIVTGKGRTSLPNLEQLDLSNNQLTQLRYARWHLPKLSLLVVALNQLTRLPDLFKLFPKLRRAFAVQNPLHCNTIRRWQQYIAEFKLAVDTAMPGMNCATSSTYKLPSGRVICCVE